MKTKKLWVRLGCYLHLTDDEVETLLEAEPDKYPEPID